MPDPADDEAALLWKLHRELNGLRADGSTSRPGRRSGDNRRAKKPSSDSQGRDSKDRDRERSYDDPGLTSSKLIKQEANSGECRGVGRGRGRAHGAVLHGLRCARCCLQKCTGGQADLHMAPPRHMLPNAARRG